MTFTRAVADGPIVLDGGLASQLSAGGHDLSDELWSARLLVDAPEAIIEAHLAFFRAGASVATTASYQATTQGLSRRGHSQAEAVGLLRRSVRLAREAVARAQDEGINRPLWIAASIGPYGAMLADGSEYRGNYGLTVNDLVAFHRPRLEILAAEGPDVLALETVPDAREAEALLTALDGIGLPAWLSFTVADGQTRAGQPLDEAFGLVTGVDGIVAVGVNCSAPDQVSLAIGPAAATGKPMVAYPNSGEEWDAISREWTGTAGLARLPLEPWLAGGVRLVGGCCRVSPTHIGIIAAAVQNTLN